MRVTSIGRSSEDSAFEPITANLVHFVSRRVARVRDVLDRDEFELGLFIEDDGTAIAIGIVIESLRHNGALARIVPLEDR